MNEENIPTKQEKEIKLHTALEPVWLLWVDVKLSTDVELREERSYLLKKPPLVVFFLTIEVRDESKESN